MAAVLGSQLSLHGPLQIGGCLSEIIDTRSELQTSSSLPASSSYTPPRPTLLSRPQHSITTTITVAPARSTVAGKRRRRGRRRPDPGEGGGDDDGGPGDGGFWGGGGWDSNDDDEGPGWSFKSQHIWMWQAICVCGLLQAVQYLITEQRQAGVQQPKQMVSLVH